MAAVTQTIRNFLGGVSRQPDQKKLPGQLRECTNAYPDPTAGLTKRPGFKFLMNLNVASDIPYSTGQLDDNQWFYINRDEDEKYLGVLDQDSNGSIRIINLVPDSNGNLVNCTITYSNNGISGYDPKTYVTTNKDNLKVLTVQDTTIITNKSVTVAALAAPSSTTTNNATVRLTGVEYSANYKVEINGQSYTKLTRNADQFNASGTNKALAADDILSDLETGINALNISGLTVTRLSTTLELSCTSAITVTATGGKDSTKLSAFSASVENVSKLPEESIQNRVVKIINTESENDSYYAKFVPNSGTSGPGFWEETLGPGMSPGLDARTMPHELVNTGLNTFVFQPISYTARLVGDDTTNSHPSFVGSKVEDAFFHNNRLGFLTNDNVSMSQVGEFFNFYHTSALAVTDSDPVDISCSSVKPAVLTAVIPTTQGLILFSKNQQFIMFSDTEVLTPSSAVIRTISSYEMDTKINPVDVGNNLAFVSKTPGYSRIFGMQTRGSQENPIVVDISRVVSEWVPDLVEEMIASPANGFIALYGKASNCIWYYRTYNDGQENLLQSWYKWEMPGKVLFSVVDNDRMYCVLKMTSTSQLGQYALLTASLTQTPEDQILINSNGQQINPYVDMYAVAHNVIYDAATKVSKCYLPFFDIPGLTPQLIVKGDADAFDGIVQSGFALKPSRGNDTNSAHINHHGDHFIVPGRDLSSVASDVIVGYSFDFNVELPNIYFSMDPDGKKSDFTANVTIARMKFAVGLSSGIGFKIKAKGRTEWTDITPTLDANYYLSDDVPLEEQNVFTVPIHQRSENVNVRLFSNSPFPLSLISMMWEGNYSPRFYKRM
tara:strand:- start:3932 stop:6436 length:2505 start_codon:yes stop_codon:yes gene_type:complete